jgi:hypothetical protein
MSKKNQHEKKMRTDTQTNKQTNKKKENVALKFDVRIFAFVS